MLLAFFMTSFCKEYYRFLLARGLLLGVGIAFAILPAFSTVPHYFSKGCGMALGLRVSGSSLS
jgi:hypothetical protein